MYTLIIGVIIFLSLLLILVVLAQNPKGGGLSSQFGGAGVSQVMGVKKTGDLLEKLTWGFSITILSLTLLSNLFIEENQNFIESPNIENVQGQAPLPNLQQSIDPNTLAPELNDLNVNTDSAN
ncbi:preprotein translocase subunit SecG [Cyclobacteriaceae bacterium]|jgi:preprotein translocase subunit SecG|nr:preprotein translocase subunit SecG [Cyclobacteriaceae bacterium]MDA9906020.1 preprotein translocase subunit SecG [Cyclobacteriaceae bacterium]MDB4316023.1 preprotein translocase subunit SecG [Cyclobacteriaceae bacterium]MDC1369648.1 preprotein translocase subunit SecG [Cyclobacteriaceae bacterium]MDC6484232.1 preprotein translocase subunit SecG [Cyclobacteriaceae bacterium]|tara:strand:+ start:4 stop:372 length:369 start_codon:yes stop_codon:yes gene_type:complete